MPLRRQMGFAGAIGAGSVAYDGSNRFFVWSTPLQKDVWDNGPTEEAARTTLKLLPVAWLKNSRSFFQAAG